MKLDEAGFTFAKHRSESATDRALFEQNLSHQMNAVSAGAAYEAEVSAFLKSLTGATDVFPQVSGLLARTSSRSQVKSWAAPANFVRLDFTEKTAQRFLGLSLAADGRDIKPYQRFAVYQTWRAISHGPQDNTLAICDGSSVPPEDAVVIDSVVGPEDVPGAFFESRLCKPRVSHRWYYLPNMEPDDLLVFKGFDSDVPNAMNSMHTAFDDPDAGDDAPPRRSLEARVFALFD